MVLFQEFFAVWFHYLKMSCKYNRSENVVESIDVVLSYSDHGSSDDYWFGQILAHEAEYRSCVGQRVRSV